MSSVTAITKEKTARIIPNAVAVFCEGEKHIFTSFMSRDATFNTMTKAWRRALARNDINSVRIKSASKMLEIKSSNLQTVMIEGDTMDGSFKGRNYDSSDSESFTNTEWSLERTSHRRLNKVPGSSAGPSSPTGSAVSLASLPSSVLLLSSLLGLLVLLLLSSVYLVLRLGHIQDRMEEAGALDITASHLDNWHNIINSRWAQRKILLNLGRRIDNVGPVRRSRSTSTVI